MTDEPPESDADSDDDAVRERLQDRADRVVEEFDQRLIDLLSWVLETETRAHIYIYLRAEAERTSEEIADGTGLYPSTVREALADLHDDGIVTRSKREHGGAGNNPYEYSAIAPSELVGDAVGDLQAQLNTVVNIDAYLADREPETSDSITITVSEPEESEES